MFKKIPLIYRVNHFSPSQILLGFYLAVVIFSTVILSLPFNFLDGVKVPFIDILFTAVSGISVTGLSTVVIADTFNTTGIVVLAIIMHLGAVGIMAVSTLIWLFIGRKIGLTERRLIMQDQNQTSFAGMVELIKQIIYVVLIVEAIGVIVLGTYFLNYFPNPGDAYFHGFFSTISAISNAGFEIGTNTIEPYKEDYFIQTIYMILIIFGAIGFPVLIEVKAYLLSRKKQRRRFRFTLFTKLTSATFFILVGIGTLFIYLIDAGNFFKDKSVVESFFYALFQSITTRSAGLSTMDVSLLTESNQLFMSMLMFIGASPSSAGGGIRTTTFALVVIFMITYARGGKRIKLFNREIHEEDLLKAVMVFVMAIGFVFSSVLIITIIEPFSMIQILFEVTSAFGTVGLSLGITENLTTFSKILLMILMFIGRIGFVTFLFTFRKDDTESVLRYPKERIIIG